ncbi:MAG: hypothetical protein DDT22_00864 [candidate division WS2 bacterium]|nr:hypothetical protein [Candidatus Lithacetigena glycinireducens]
MKIKQNEHVFIAGRTGSGKTFLTRKYLAGFQTVIVLDTKGTLTWQEVEEKELTIVTRLTDLPQAKTSKVIYKPEYNELSFEWYDAFFKYCYFRQNVVVWVDEVMAICPNPHKIPEFYKAILTRGREMGVAAWSLTQRPSGIPVIIMSEATHFFVFDLNMPQDRDRLVEVTGTGEFEEKPGKYKFWYYNVNRTKATKAVIVEGKE